MIPRLHSSRFAFLLAAALLCAVFASGCGTKESAETNTNSEMGSTTGDTAGGAMAESAPPSDANIAAIVLAADDADIDNGKLAQGKSKNSEVETFAKQMVTDHSAVNKKAKDLAGKLKLDPEDNDASRKLKTDTDAARDALKPLDGAAFDKAYVDNEVAYHQQVLDVIDNTLIPNAQNAELKQLLEDTRPVIAAHLEHAKKLQTSMSGTSSNTR